MLQTSAKHALSQVRTASWWFFKAKPIKERKRPQLKQIYSTLKPFMNDPSTKALLRKSFVLLLAAKSMGIMSPYLLKIAVNGIASHTGLAAVISSILAYGGIRVAGVALNEHRGVIGQALNLKLITQLSNKLFAHVHKLDYLYQKNNGTRSAMFATSRAIRNLESGIRFAMTHLIPTFTEFGLMATLIYFYCGTKYLLTMVGMVACYTAYTNIISNRRQVLIRNRKDVERGQEAFLNETLINYEAVKCFQREKHEQSKYNGFIKKYMEQALMVQKSLGDLNVGQNMIFSVGLCANLIFTVLDCYAGIMTPGDFVMLQALFLQLWSPMNMLGSTLRELDESVVHFEEIYKILSIKPM